MGSRYERFMVAPPYKFDAGPQFDHMMALVDAGEVDPPKRSHLEIDRRVVHNLCISRAIAACSRTLSRRGG
jgi:hypothetical protein